MNAHHTLLNRLDQIARSVPEFTLRRDPGSQPGAGAGELTLWVRCPMEVWTALTESLGASSEVAASLVLGAGHLGLVLSDGSTALLQYEGRPGSPADLAERRPGEMAARFWFSLISLAGAVQAVRPFSGHGWLEVARESLLDLYRSALTPGSTVKGWLGLDTVPGAQALAPLSEWLVCPLEVQAQRRCGVRLAETYERLTLALFDRLELPYPWVLRNMAFQALDRARPVGSVAVEGGPDPEPARQQTGPARFRVKRRGSP